MLFVSLFGQSLPILWWFMLDRIAIDYCLILLDRMIRKIIRYSLLFTLSEALFFESLYLIVEINYCFPHLCMHLLKMITIFLKSLNNFVLFFGEVFNLKLMICCEFSLNF